MSQKTHLREDDRYPAIKIYRLASIIADITTDYARKFLVSVGMGENQIDIMNNTFRPVIDFYESDFYGIAPTELRRLMREFNYNLISQREESEIVFRLIQRFSEGRGKFLWSIRDAAYDLESYIANAYVSSDIFKKFEKLFRKIITKPHYSLIMNYSIEQNNWRNGIRTTWDETINNHIFANLDIQPDIYLAYRYFNLRLLVEEVMNIFDEQERKILDDEIIHILLLPESYSLKNSGVHHFMSFDELARRSAEEWHELCVDLESGFSD